MKELNQKDQSKNPSKETEKLLLHQLISAQAQRSPNAVALVEPVISESSEEAEGPETKWQEAEAKSLTYAELELQSDALAGYLQQQGCRPNSIIGIFMETSIDYVVAMLAALKAGAAYMPLDLAHPELLLKRIIEQTEICIILTHTQWLPRLEGFPEQQVLALDADADSSAATWQNCLYRKDLLAGVDIDNYAYVVFSSGTSGEPKGIVAPHRGAIHSYFERFRYFAVQPGDRAACNVFFIWEVLRPLLVGASSYIVPDSLIYDPRRLLAYLRRWQITEILFTPSLLEKVLQSRRDGPERDLFDQAFSHVKAIWLNGEVVTRSLGEKILQAFAPDKTQIFNLYSISECHDVAVTELHQMHRTDADFCSVGKVMPGVVVHIFRYGKSLENSKVIAPSKNSAKSFDANLLIPCFPGDPRDPLTQGEIYVGGPTLALGYLNKPETTAERFIYWKPNAESQPLRLYRTGDLGRFLLPEGAENQKEAAKTNSAEWPPKGDIEIEVDGRCDFMVKLRGYSVHLGMIEAALCACPGVLHAAALPYGEEGSDKRLVAYVVRDPAASRASEANWQIEDGFCPELLDVLKEHLPYYMLPQTFVELQNIPLEPVSGKADHKKLPEPPASQAASALPLDDLAQAYSLGSMKLESIIEQLWSRILNLAVSEPLRQSSFFDLGGHSLLAAELAIAFEQVFGRSISVRQIYMYPTIADQLRWLESAQKEPAEAEPAADANQSANQSTDPSDEPSDEPSNAQSYGQGDAQKQLVVQMRSDAQLEAKTLAMLSGKKIEAKTLSEARYVFVTGATGFLGAFVLAELKARAPRSCQFHCLVRSADEQAGLQRILDNLAYYGLLYESNAADWRDAIIAHPGDLGRERLGLAQADYEKLAELDLIFHCGSLVNYLYPYEVIRGPTVGGVQGILALAARAQAALHFISTNGIYASADAEPYFGEDQNIDSYAEFLDNGYGQGKWVAEKIVWQAVDAGLPVCLYRPGNLGHSSLTGRYNPNDFQTLIIQAALRLGSAPLRPQWAFEFSPVDFLAACVVDFAGPEPRPERSEPYGEVFNFVESQTQDTLALFERMQREGLVERLLPYEEWLALLRQKAQQSGDKNLFVLSEGLDDVELWLDDNSIYDDSKLQAQLRLRAMQRPVTDLAYYWQLVEALSVRS